MKKLLLIFFVLVSFVSFAQPAYNTVNTRNNWLAGIFRNGLHVPAGCGYPSLFTSQWVGDGAIYLDSCNNKIYWYRNSAWWRIADTSYAAPTRFGVAGEDDTFNEARFIDGNGQDFIVQDGNEFYWSISGTHSSNNFTSYIDMFRTFLEFQHQYGPSTTTIGMTPTTTEAQILLRVQRGNQSDITLTTDSFTIKPPFGKITIDSLRSGTSDTTTNKPMTWNPTTGAWKYLTSWPGGGSSSASLTSTRIGFGDGSNLLSGDADFTFDATNSHIQVNNVTAGNGMELNGSTPTLKLKGLGTPAVQFRDASNLGNSVVMDANYNFSFMVQGYATERIYIKQSNGFIGMNNMAPTFQLDVTGTGRFTSSVQFESHIDWADISAPSTPSSGFLRNYANSDRPWFKDDAGNAFAYSYFTESSDASSATPTPRGYARQNDYYLTALAAGATFAAPSGTPVNGNRLIIRIKDNGGAQTLAWNAIYRAGDISLPTTTVASKTLYVGFVYNSASSTWDCVSKVDNF